MYCYFFICVCVFEFNVAFNNFSVISRQCLVATGSSMLTFIVLPQWSIMSQVWVPSEEQLVSFFYDFCMSRPGIVTINEVQTDQGPNLPRSDIHMMENREHYEKTDRFKHFMETLSRLVSNCREKFCILLTLILLTYRNFFKMSENKEKIFCTQCKIIGFSQRLPGFWLDKALGKYYR